MRHLRACRALLVLSGVLLASPPVFSDVPHLIRYQGTAVDSQGVPLEGPYTLTFRLYEAASGGTAVWAETQPDVPVIKGHFSVLLGSVAPLTNMDWSHPCWLAVLVNGEELLPRQPITSVPLAVRAHTAELVKTSGLTDDDHSLVPPGAVILWTGNACPEGYQRLSSYDDRFLVGSATAGSLGGSINHDHGGATRDHGLSVAELPAHIHALPSDACGNGDMPTIGMNNTPNADESFGCQTTGATGGGQGHAHTIATDDSRPPFQTILLCQKD